MRKGKETWGGWVEGWGVDYPLIAVLVCFDFLSVLDLSAAFHFEPEGTYMHTLTLSIRIDAATRPYSLPVHHRDFRAGLHLEPMARVMLASLDGVQHDIRNHLSNSGRRRVKDPVPELDRAM